MTWRMLYCGGALVWAIIGFKSASLLWPIDQPAAVAVGVACGAVVAALLNEVRAA